MSRPLFRETGLMAVTFTQILFHVVFSTMHTAPLIGAGVREELYSFVADTVRRNRGQLAAIGGMPDHVHLLIRLKPHVPVSSMVRFVKASSSRWMKERPDLVRDFAWQPGYAAFSVSESRSEAVKTYIRNQEIHHAREPFETEIQTLLRRHSVAFEDGATVTRLLSHVVFSTKHRAPLIGAGVRADLYSFVADTVQRHGGQLLAIGGMPDHVHLLIRLKPYVPVSAMVRFVKVNSSSWLGSDLVPNFAWQTGYAAFSVSESRSEAVRTYIRNQEIHHARRSFETEVQTLLRRHNIAFDPAHLLD